MAAPRYIEVVLHFFDCATKLIIVSSRYFLLCLEVRINGYGGCEQFDI